MSRISANLLSIPEGVRCSISDSILSVSGKKGSLTLKIPQKLKVSVQEEGIFVGPETKELEQDAKTSALCGTIFRLSKNMIHGVSEGFEKILNLVGVGYKAELKGRELHLSLGFSHPVVYKIKEGVDIIVEKPVQIKVVGIDKQKVGQVASEIRDYRKPEPYKGKGIHYAGEYVRRKEGKNK